MLVEYKLYCFYGKVRLICQDIEKNGRRYTNVLDENFQPLDVRHGYARLPYALTEKKQELKEIAQTLAAPFAFVRVDLYAIQTHIYFSELTFTPATCVLPNFKKSFLLSEGEKLILGSAH